MDSVWSDDRGVYLIFGKFYTERNKTIRLDLISWALCDPKTGIARNLVWEENACGIGGITAIVTAPFQNMWILLLQLDSRPRAFYR